MTLRRCGGRLRLRSKPLKMKNAETSDKSNINWFFYTSSYQLRMNSPKRVNGGDLGLKSMRLSVEFHLLQMKPFEKDFAEETGLERVDAVGAEFRELKCA